MTRLSQDLVARGADVSLLWLTTWIASRFQSQLFWECPHVLTSVLFCFVFFLEVSQQKEAFIGSEIVVPLQSRSEQRALLAGTSLPRLPSCPEEERGLASRLCVPSDLHGWDTRRILESLNGSPFLTHPREVGAGWRSRRGAEGLISVPGFSAGAELCLQRSGRYGKAFCVAHKCETKISQQAEGCSASEAGCLKNRLIFAPVL